MDMNRVLDIRDMIWQIAGEWKRIVICMAIAALLLNGYQAVRSYEAARSAQQVQPQDAASYRENLSEEKADAVEKAFQIYEQYNRTYQMAKKYCNHAIRMQLDYTEVPTVNLIYQAANCGNITSLYSFIEEGVLSDDWLESVLEELGWEDVPPAYVSELISFSALGEEDAVSQPAFRIKIISTDQESAEMIADLVQQEILAQDAQIRSAYNGVTLQLVEQEYRVNVDNDVLSGQQWHKDQMNNARNVLNGLSSSFDDGQKSYYAVLMEQSEAEDVQDTEEADTETPVSFRLVQPKALVLGLIGGAVIACGFYALRYLLDRHLRSASELEDSLGVLLLETAEDAGSDDWLAMAGARIRMEVERQGFSSLYVTSSSGCEQIERFRAYLEEKLAQSGCQVYAGGPVNSDPDALEQISRADSAVFLEEVHKSLYDEIARQTELCQKNETFVIGAVVFSDKK